jgi:tRNA A-37 threonylcarbamoyl transferase component Bud32
MSEEYGYSGKRSSRSSTSYKPSPIPTSIEPNSFDLFQETETENSNLPSVKSSASKPKSSMNSFLKTSFEKEKPKKFKTIEAAKQIQQKLEIIKLEYKKEKEKLSTEFQTKKNFFEKKLILKKFQENKMAILDLPSIQSQFYLEREIALEIVKIDGMFLGNFSDEFKKDKTIAMESIKQNGFSLEFINQDLLVHNPMIFIEAYKTSPDIKEKNFILPYSVLHQIALNIQFRGLDYFGLIVEIFQIGAEIERNADAHYQLGLIYFEGSEKDFQKAKILFEQAIKLKHPEALNKLKMLNTILNSFNSEEISNLERRTNINEYNIISKIGKGAQGTVYKVKRKKDDAIFAMKSMELDLDDLNSSIKEVIMMTKVKHPRVCEIIDFFAEVNDESESFMFHIIMPVYKNDLFHYLHKNVDSVNESVIIDFIKEITEAIHHLHSNGIIHRDIKPENVFISQNNSTVVGDFGLSCQSSMKTLRKTKVGTLSKL